VPPSLPSRDDWGEWITWHGIDLDGGISARFTDDPGGVPPGLIEALAPDRASLVIQGGHADLDDEGDITCHFRAQVFFESAPYEAGLLEFRLDTRDESATLERMYLPRAEHGSHHGKRLMLRSVRLLDGLEIRWYRLTAQAVGKYLWANCGFDFDPGYAEIVNAACARFAALLDLIESPEAWEPLEHPWEFAALNVDDDGDPVAIPRELAQARLDEAGWQVLPPLPAGTEVTPSKALLIHSRYFEWRGTFDLHEPLAHDILARYAGTYDDHDP
jgi:hypothetical protein